jgi:hypothetical protein
MKHKSNGENIINNEISGSYRNEMISKCNRNENEMKCNLKAKMKEAKMAENMSAK